MLHPDASKLSSIATKINALNTKSGPFDPIILIGDALPEEEDTLSTVRFEPQILCAPGSQSLKYVGDDHRELEGSNISYLGKYGTLTKADGITIAFVTGDEKVLDDEMEQILQDLRGKKVDVLITYQWPYAIANERELFFGNTNIDRIVRQTQPQYHFAVGSNVGKFFERPPFQWSDSLTNTRFISLGEFESGDKWIYAFNINATQELKPPANLTPNPFETEEVTQPKKRVFEEPLADDTSKKIRLRKVVSPENCFFCLSNPKLESHMIISIGEHAYLTIAKGPLTRPTRHMNFSGHCIIIPVAHIPSLDSSYDNKSVVETPLYNEIMRYQVSLVKFFDSFELATVFFQINKADSVHFHIQCFPIPADFLTKFSSVLERKSKYNNEKLIQNTKLMFQKFEDTEDPKYLEFIDSKKDYISFTLFNRSISKQEVYITYIDCSKSLDLQFGRRVLADLLQTPKRIKWDKCKQSRTVEEQETEAFKEKFKSYDFTMEG